MPDIDILNPHSSLCTPYEQYQEYLAYGEQVGSFFAADADADAQHGACTWAERDAHAGALATVAEAEGSPHRVFCAPPSV